MKEKAIPNRYLVDFDGTLCKSTFNETTGKYDMGEANDPIANAVTDLSWDNEIIIFTSRPKGEWNQVRDWLDKQAIRYHKIKHKPLAKAYIDDRAINPNCGECLERMD